MVTTKTTATSLIVIAAVSMIGTNMAHQVIRADELPRTGADLDICHVQRKVKFEMEDMPKLVRKNLHVGSVLPGQAIQCSLVVENLTEKSYDFNKIQTGCDCLQVSPKAATLGPGERVTFDVTIKTVNRPSQQHHKAAFIAFADGRYSFGIVFEYSMRGIVGFPDASVQIRMPRDSEAMPVQIPFFVDDQVASELVDIEIPKPFADIPHKIHFDKRTLEMRISKEFLLNGRILGEVTIRNIETGFRDTILIDIDAEESISIMPSTPRFYSKASPKTEQNTNEPNPHQVPYVGRLLIYDRTGDLESAPIADFYYKDTKITSRLVRRQNTVSHYELTINLESAQAKASEQNHHIRCVVRSKASSIDKTLPFIMAETNANSALNQIVPSP